MVNKDNNQEIWAKVKIDLENQLSSGEFGTLFKKAKFAFDKQDPSKVLVITTSPFIREWIRKGYLNKLMASVKKYSPQVKQIAFEKGFVRNKIGGSKSAAEEADREINIEKKDPRPSTLNSNYTLNNYVVGSNSELAFAAAQAVINSPGTSYNPLYIYGGVGLGKTHLLQATGNAIFDKYGSKVLYLPSELFLSAIVSAIQKGSIEDLKNKYRNVDVLILDDIQIISGKEKFQEIFFDTFNALHSKGKQIILSSDCLPSDIPALEDRLRSRFHGGMIADISLPDLETRIAILRLKAEKQGVNVPEETIEFIAEKMASNIRQMEGALNRLVVQCQMTQEEASLETAQKILVPIAKETAALVKKISPEKLLSLIAEHFHITVDDLKSKTRRQEVALPRQMAMFLLRKDNNMPLPTIGKILGGRDHSTVIHAIQKIEDIRSKDSNIEKDLGSIRQKIKREC